MRTSYLMTADEATGFLKALEMVYERQGFVGQAELIKTIRDALLVEPAPPEERGEE